MSGLSDLHDYDMTDAERLALCAELKRLNRLSPSHPAEREAASPCAGSAPAGLGDHYEVIA